MCSRALAALISLRFDCSLISSGEVLERARQSHQVYVTIPRLCDFAISPYLYSLFWFVWLSSFVASIGGMFCSFLELMFEIHWFCFIFQPARRGAPTCAFISRCEGSHVIAISSVFPVNSLKKFEHSVQKIHTPLPVFVVIVLFTVWLFSSFLSEIDTKAVNHERVTLCSDCSIFGSRWSI